MFKPAFTCSMSTMEKHENIMLNLFKAVTDVIDVVPVPLLLTLNKFRTL